VELKNRFQGKTLEISIEVKDVGARGFTGTLFELKQYNTEGVPTALLSVGITDNRNTFARTGGGNLQIDSSLINHDFKVKELPKPTVDHDGNIASINGHLLLLQPRQLGALQRYDRDLDIWTSITDADVIEMYLGRDSDEAKKCGVVFSVSAQSLRSRYCAFFDGRLIYSANAQLNNSFSSSLEALPQFISSDALVLEDSGTIIHCVYESKEWSDYPKSNCDHVNLNAASNSLYAVIQDPSTRDVLATTNAGQIFQFSQKEPPAEITTDDNTRRQFYSAFFRHDDIHLASFPNGTFWKWNPSKKRLERTNLGLSLSKYESEAMIEPQSIAAYAGRLWAGVWPFGKLYEVDINLKCCLTEFTRLFPGPEINPESLRASSDDPFGGFAASRKMTLTTDSASLGQRIPAITHWQGALVASTARTYYWTDKIDIESAASTFDSRLLGAYGKIYEIRSGNSLFYEYDSVTKSWSGKINIKFANNRLTVTYPNGRRVTREVKNELTDRIEWNEILIAKGSFGVLDGAEVKLHVVTTP
jgi:hypothetical protein